MIKITTEDGMAEGLAKKKWQCPRCEVITKDYPAVSRRDNKTYVCSKCGTQEALFDFACGSGRASKREIEDEKKWLK